MHIHHVQSLADDSVSHLTSPLPAAEFEVPEGYVWLYSQTEEELEQERSWINLELLDEDEFNDDDDICF